MEDEIYMMFWLDKKKFLLSSKKYDDLIFCEWEWERECECDCECECEWDKLSLCWVKFFYVVVMEVFERKYIDYFVEVVSYIVCVGGFVFKEIVFWKL